MPREFSSFLGGKARDQRKDRESAFAEDEVLLRLMMAEVLRGQGFQVFEASDGEEGISILRAMPADVVITDLRMDTLTDGLELARYVRAECPQLSPANWPRSRRFPKRRPSGSRTCCANCIDDCVAQVRTPGRSPRHEIIGMRSSSYERHRA